MRKSFLLTIAVTALLEVAAHSGELEIPLEVKDIWGIPGPRRVTGGVPLLPGQAADTSRLRLATKSADGALTLVPAQFQVLARWWRKDDSIRWVLADFATELAAGEAKTFFLTASDQPAPEAPGPLVVNLTDELIEISTGPARFTVNRKRFSFLQKVAIDADGDGQFADGETVLDGSADFGVVVEDTYGEKYYGSEGTRSVEIIDRGPMRVCIRAKGRNLARDGKGYSGGMYGYDCFLNFYAGSTDVYADLILTNNPSRSIGSPTFEDASLVLKLAGKNVSCSLHGSYPLRGALAEGPDAREKEADFRLQKDQVTSGALQPGESLCLYQDSNGAPSWQTCQGYDDNGEKQGWTFPAGATASFRGYRVLKRTAAGEETAAEGDHARGLLHARTDRGGVVVHTKHFWEQFPKAAEAFGDGTVRVGLFPREYKVPHFLEDASAKGHEIVLHFHAPGRAGPYPGDEQGGPLAQAVADCWDGRVYPRPPLEHIAATGALADLGPFIVPNSGLGSKPDTRNSIDSRRMLTEDVFYGNAYGWQIFGERWRSQGGAGNHGARQPIEEDDYLRRWYWTGTLDWLAVGDARSRHFRDVRCYRIEDQDPFSFADWQTYRAGNVSERRADRPQPEGEEYDKYTQGMWHSRDCNAETPPPGNRLAFFLPNPEHNVIDLLYDRYLLFGDVRCLENMRIIAATGFYHTAYHEPVVFRAPGWCWRTLDRYWELTGDQAAGKALRQLAEHYLPLAKNPPLACKNANGGVHWWFTGIFCRAVALAALHTEDPNTLTLARACAVDKEKNVGQVRTLFTVLYHLTGEEQYRKLLMPDEVKPAEPANAGQETPDETPPAEEPRYGIGGYLRVCDEWLLQQPPRAKPATPAPPEPQ